MASSLLWGFPRVCASLLLSSLHLMLLYRVCQDTVTKDVSSLLQSLKKQRKNNTNRLCNSASPWGSKVIFSHRSSPGTGHTHLWSTPLSGWTGTCSSCHQHKWLHGEREKREQNTLNQQTSARHRKRLLNCQSKSLSDTSSTDVPWSTAIMMRLTIIKWHHDSWHSLALIRKLCTLNWTHLWRRWALFQRRTHRESRREPETWKSSTWSWSIWEGNWLMPNCERRTQ